MSISPDKTIDCKNMSCPEPILHTKMAINELEQGQILEMIATDPGSVADMSAWANRTGNELLESNETDGVYQYLIKKT